jgi:hypothetical protein
MRIFKILLVALPLMLMACSKGGDSTPTPPPVVVVPEADIAFKVEFTPDTEIDYTKLYGAIGGAQDIIVKITSTLPKDGVTIDVTVTKDADNTTIFNKNITATTASNTIKISGLLTEKSTAKVLVTSKTLDPESKTYKSFSRTFKISAK